MLACLSVSPNHTATREHIASLLWGCHGEKQARSNLRQSLAVLRKELGSAKWLVRTHEDTLVLDAGAIRVDALEILACADFGDLTRLRRAACCHRGEFLADISLRDDVFEEWLNSEISRFKSIAIQILDRLSRLETGPACIEAAQSLVKLDPLREASHRLLMRAHAAQGDNGQALKQYEQCRTVLRDELQVEPAQETQELRREIATASGGAKRNDFDAIPTATTYPKLPGRPSIAVLPFSNMSGDPEQGYFCDGMVDDIITELSRFRSLFVIARNSSFAYKDRIVEAKQVGRELGVRYLLEGSVRKAGLRVRIVGQLIDAHTGAHLWADRFDGSLEDIFNLQDQVTLRVIGAIAPTLEYAEIERAKRKPTENLDAYDYFQRGMAGVHLWDRAANTEALANFYRAIELDPNFASAYGMAARCYSQRKASAWVINRTDEIAETYRLAQRAAALGKDDAVALSAAGIGLAFVVGKVEAGNSLIERALALNPNLAWAWVFSGWAKVWLGEYEAAIDRLARAMRLSPNDSQMGNIQAATASAHFFAGRYSEALAWAEMARRREPSHYVAGCFAAATYALTGRIADAQEVMTLLRQADPQLRVSKLQELFPIQVPADLARWAEGLRQAGLPA